MTNKKESPNFSELSFIKFRFGNDLSSREATLRVLSAREVFTTVFGMGTGGVLLLSHRKAFVLPTFEIDFGINRFTHWKLHNDKFDNLYP